MPHTGPHQPNRTASDLLVHCLELEQIPVVLGVPGEENADVMMSLEASSIRFISTRHEQGAAFAASVYGRLTGNPLACLATLGPGAANLVTGVADANMDHAPLLVLTGPGSTDRLHKKSHQIMDVVSMYRPITKWATSVRIAHAIPETVRKAVRIARVEKPGAVLIELPEDVAKHTTDAHPLEPRRYRRSAPNEEAVDAAVELLASARRPMVLAGNGAIRTRASASLRRLADNHALPVTSTFMGKGAVPRGSAHCLFTVGIQEKDRIAHLLGDADVVLAVGYDLVEYPPSSWAGDETRIIHVDFLPAEIDAAYHPEVELVGDIALGLDALASGLSARGVRVARNAAAAYVRDAMLDELRAHAEDDTQGSIRPQKLLWDIRQALSPSDVLLSGVGAHKMWIGRHYHCDEPNTCLIPNGFCSMGQPLPGLIGARLARPDVRCVAVCGDGDFLMNVQEMETIARLGLDVTAVVWEDNEYGLISWKQQAEFGRHTDLSFGNPSWVGLAESFGWRGERVERSRDFAPALRRALDHPGPALLVAPVDYRENMKLTERLGAQICRI
jgi:acetolactate synthase-1/2/3 large subunit